MALHLRISARTALLIVVPRSNLSGPQETWTKMQMCKENDGQAISV